MTALGSSLRLAAASLLVTGVSGCGLVGSSWETFTSDDGLGDDHVTAVAAANGEVWAGTAGGGVARFDGGEWIAHTAADGLAADHVNAVAVDDGAVWAATSGGLSRFDGDTWDTSALADQRVNAVAAAGGAVWAGGRALTRLDGGDERAYTRADGLAHDWVNAVAVAVDGAVWATTSRGLSRFDGSEWTTFSADRIADGGAELTLPDRAVLAVAAGPDGAVAVGTASGGLAHFDGSDWTTHTTDDGLAADRVTSAAIDRDGSVWAGTLGGGVSQFDGEEWTTHTTDDGLAADRVTAVAAAGDGTVWAATPEGISRLDR